MCHCTLWALVNFFIRLPLADNLEHFIKITEHPEGSDLIYYPEGNNDGSATAIIKEVKEWRAKNGKPGFKKVNYYSCLTSLDIG